MNIRPFHLAFPGIVACWLAVTAPCAGQVFQPVDLSPKKGSNPCPKATVPDDIYDEFKDMLAGVLSAGGGVVADIDAQVQKHVPKKRPVRVEFDVVDKDTFRRVYANDVDGLPGNEGRTPKELHKEADGLFDGLAAYAYISDKQVIKIKVFCKDSLRTGTIDGDLRKLLVHELVHAKLYVMLVLGVPKDRLPFQDHDMDDKNDDKPPDEGGDKPFFDEVERLFALLKKNLKIC